MTDRQKTTLRRLLLIGVPLAVMAVASVLWLTGGRYVSTDNAYVKADKIMLSPEISGTVLERLVDNNATVKKGDLLLVIDQKPFEIALAKAVADLATAKSDIAKLRSDYAQKKEELAIAQSGMTFADAEYDRAATLVKTSAVSESRLDEATRNRDAAHAQVALLEREIEGIAAQLDGRPDAPAEEHASYKAAFATAEQAQLNLDHTKIFAPASGIVGNMPAPGDYARAGVPILSLISTDRVWIEANFKETQIEHIKPGQDVEVSVDTYPDRTWHGTVESISPATGAEFSILPAQNATGNWVKVVQRIAVRVRIDDAEAPGKLRPGMSADTKVDLQSGT